jgi:hypothetical protein
MLATDKFVFLHFPHAGGTFVYEIIKKFFPSAVEIGYHLPRALIPKEYAHLPILGTVRNPWDFYVSWYHFQISNEGYSPSKNALFCCVSEDRSLDFVQTIRNALDLGTNEEKLNFLIQSLPEEFDYQKRRIPNLTREQIRPLRGSGLGLYTFRFNQMFGRLDDISFCRVEFLRDELLNFFDRAGIANDELRRYVLGLDKQNTSEHRHYSTYYPPDLAQLVLARDQLLIERFGYVFKPESQKLHAM